MLAASIASFLFIMSSSLFGIPISGTHTVVGALIGAGLVGTSASALNWEKLTLIVSSWFLSPLLSATLCFLNTLLLCWLTWDPKKRLTTRLFWLSTACVLTFILITYMLMALMADKDTTIGSNSVHFIYLGCSGLLGLILSRVFIQVIAGQKDLHWWPKTLNVLKVWSMECLLR